MKEALFILLQSAATFALFFAVLWLVWKVLFDLPQRITELQERVQRLERNNKEK